MDHPLAPLLVGVEYQVHISERRVGHDPGWAQRVSAVNEKITKPHLRW
ncbi:MAG TPA: hypothetical protein VFZ97_13240 [Acidimicrobiales bacterium]